MHTGYQIYMKTFAIKTGHFFLYIKIYYRKIEN